MTKEPKSECQTLSRFFHRNVKKLRNVNIEDFEKSADFNAVIAENKSVETRKKAKRKVLGPQFKGFTHDDKWRSDIKAKQLDKSFAKIESNFVKSEGFLKSPKEDVLDPEFKGFTNEDQWLSKIDGYQFNKSLTEFENNAIKSDALGFSAEEVSDPQSNFTNGVKWRSEIEQDQLSKSLAEIENIIEKSDSLGLPNIEVLSPSCNGFTNGDKWLLSEIKKDHSITKIVNTIEISEDFFGFSQEEIDCSSALCDKYKSRVEYFLSNTSECCRGFSKQDQNESISDLSDILEKCVSIRSEIYKNIDRRILSYHLKGEMSGDKEISSKYWPKQEWKAKLEEGNRNGKNQVNFHSIHSIKFRRNLRSRTCAKIDKIKTESIRIKQENKIHNFKQSMWHNSLSSTRDIKQEEASFIKIKQELIIPPFVPPKSPHHLIEEDLYHDPWALLIATIFLNKTSGRTARPYVFWFLDENPDPLIVLGKRVDQLETYFGALGLQRTRASQVWRMSHDFIYKKWQRVSELYGIGRYGEEAFRMFCLGDLSFSPKDRYLRIYRAWYEMQDKNARLQEMNS